MGLYKNNHSSRIARNWACFWSNILYKKNEEDKKGKYHINIAINIVYFFSKKEVFQPHLPVRLPCYDLAPVTSFTLGRSLRWRTSGASSFHGLTGGVYKARERIHRAMADARLLAIPASRSRVADSDPNWDELLRLASSHLVAALCTRHCSTCVALDVRAVMIWRHPHLPLGLHRQFL